MWSFFTRDVWTGFFLASCAFSVLNGQAILVPIEIRSVETVPGTQSTKVAVTYLSPKSTNVKWSIDDGLSPTDVNTATRTPFSRNDANHTNSASIVIPHSLPFQVLMLDLTCRHSSFEVHIEFGITHSSQSAREAVVQYSMFMPRESEIGISSKGKTRFHVYVNTTGSKFSFGMLQAEAHFIDGGSTKINSSTAYSFMPSIWMDSLKIQPNFNTSNEYHADILLDNPSLRVSGGMVTISAACRARSSLITRLDIKQALYFHARPESSAVPPNSLGLVKDMSPAVITVKPSGSAVLKCTAIGNPAPNVYLYKKQAQELHKVNVPSYMTALPFQTATVFQFLNVTPDASGTYLCVAYNGVKTTQIGHELTVMG